MTEPPRVFLHNPQTGEDFELKSEALSIEVGRDTVDYVYEWPALQSFEVEFDLTRVYWTRFLRISHPRAKVSRRKIWRYMEYVGV